MRYVHFILAVLILVSGQSLLAIADTTTPSNNAYGYTFSGPLHKIELDRPDDSSLVVHQGAIQIENGITRTWNNHGNYIDLPETLVRIGLTSRMEGRLLLPDYYAGRANSPIHSGITGSGAGLKIRLVPRPNSQFDLSAIAMLGFPTGTHGLSSHALEPSLRFPWSYNLRGPWGLSGRASFFFPTINNRVNTTFAPAISLDRQMGKKADIFIEYEQDYLAFGRPRAYFTLGGFRRVRTNQIADMYLAAGLTQTSPTLALGFGYTFHIDRNKSN